MKSWAEECAERYRARALSSETSIWDTFGSAIESAIRETIEKCAQVANQGRQYAEGDIRSVVAAIRCLTTEMDPWGEHGG